MNLKAKPSSSALPGHCPLIKCPMWYALVKAGRRRPYVMTQNATEFITPMVFETLTNRLRCIVDTFDRSFQYDVAHVSLANAADLSAHRPARPM